MAQQVDEELILNDFDGFYVLVTDHFLRFCWKSAGISPNRSTCVISFGSTSRGVLFFPAKGSFIPSWARRFIDWVQALVLEIKQ